MAGDGLDWLAKAAPVYWVTGISTIVGLAKYVPDHVERQRLLILPPDHEAYQEPTGIIRWLLIVINWLIPSRRGIGWFGWARAIGLALFRVTLLWVMALVVQLAICELPKAALEDVVELGTISVTWTLPFIVGPILSVIPSLALAKLVIAGAVRRRLSTSLSLALLCSVSVIGFGLASAIWVIAAQIAFSTYSLDALIAAAQMSVFVQRDGSFAAMNDGVATGVANSFVWPSSDGLIFPGEVIVQYVLLARTVALLAVAPFFALASIHLRNWLSRFEKYFPEPVKKAPIALLCISWTFVCGLYFFVDHTLSVRNETGIEKVAGGCDKTDDFSGEFRLSSQRLSLRQRPQLSANIAGTTKAPAVIKTLCKKDDWILVRTAIKSPTSKMISGWIPAWIVELPYEKPKLTSNADDVDEDSLYPFSLHVAVDAIQQPTIRDEIALNNLFGYQVRIPDVLQAAVEQQQECEHIAKVSLFVPPTAELQPGKQSLENSMAVLDCIDFDRRVVVPISNISDPVDVRFDRQACEKSAKIQSKQGARIAAQIAALFEEQEAQFAKNNHENKPDQASPIEAPPAKNCAYRKWSFDPDPDPNGTFRRPIK